MITISMRKTAFLRLAALALLGSGILSAPFGRAQSTPAKPAPPPPPPADVLVLANGDTLHGKLLNSVGGNVTFHSDMVGDVTVAWDKVKELHSGQQFSIIPKGVELSGKKKAPALPSGTLDAEDNSIKVTGANTAAPIPVANVAFIVDKPSADKLLYHEPNFFQAWNGSATLGATIINSSTRQFTYTAGVGLVRTVPNVSWLNTRNRTSFNFAASYGEITQPAYTDNTATPPTTVPVNTIKSGIIHFDGERDEYVSPRLFVLGQFALDHNYSLDLHLQQIYGGGLGVTVIKTPKQELDAKATVQYEKQDFTNAAGDNLIGSTFAGAYQLHTKFFSYTQGVNYIPAWNDTTAWSFNEVNQISFPTYKNLSFSIGTLDTYLNNPPATLPPTVNNSFQFTFGLTYAIKSKY
jgi:Protein of unknown function, DUF481